MKTIANFVGAVVAFPIFVFGLLIVVHGDGWYLKFRELMRGRV